MGVVVITGTSTGIGLLTALQFARPGNKVYATMRDLARATALREAAEAEGLNLEIVQLDVTDATSCRQAIEMVRGREGRIDVLVNNAGIGVPGALERVSDEDAHLVMETNFHGPLRLMQLVLPLMREQGGGTIVNVSSVAGRLSASAQGLYHCSKWALECASETVAQEAREYGVRVAIIEPGFFVTPILDKAVSTWDFDPDRPYADMEGRMHFLYSQALETAGDPADVARAIENAVTTTDPRLRYLVGVDAEVFVSGRDRMSDEEWVDFGRKRSDDDYWAEFAQRFPMPAEA